MTSKVTFVGRQLLSPQVEGHYVAACRLIQAASCSDVDPYVITLEQKGTLIKKTDNRFAVINPVLRPPLTHGMFPSLFLALNDAIVSAKISSYIKDSDCDLIHVLNLNKEAYLFSHVLSRVKKPLLLHMLHSQFVLNDDVFKLRKIMFKLRIFGGVFPTHMISINESMRNFLINTHGIDEEYVHYVPLPVDHQKFKPLNKDELRKKYGLPNNRPIVAYAGSLNPSRGIFDLVKAFSHVLDNCPDAILFVSYLRRKGEEIHEETLRSMVKNPKIKDNIVLTGPSSCVEEIYNLGDVVALPFARPYWVEPPLVLLEAMSCGAAIVSTTAGAIGETVNNQNNGVLVPPKDPVSLGTAIADLLSNPAKTNEIAKNARQTIIERYSYEKVGNRLKEVYQQIQNI